MCRNCKIDYPKTADFYTTLHGVIRTYTCRSCHAKLLRERYEAKKKQGYKLKMVYCPEQPKDAQIKNENK